MDFEYAKKIIEYQSEIGISFTDLKMLELALTHKSYANEFKKNRENNEKLELLGDSVLNLLVVEYLYKQFSNYTEGKLSRIKSVAVSEASLADIAKEIGLSEYILLGKGEIACDGNKRPAILADTLEALLGAYYLDSGMDKVRLFLIPYIAMVIYRYEHNEEFIDYKTNLQLYSQNRFKKCPLYKTIKSEGPDHSKTFFVSVKIGSKNYGTGKGHNKKSAQQNAASIALEKIKMLEEKK